MADEEKRREARELVSSSYAIRSASRMLSASAVSPRRTREPPPHQRYHSSSCCSPPPPFDLGLCYPDFFLHQLLPRLLFTPTPPASPALVPGPELPPSLTSGTHPDLL
uniref:Uncharacterized protein n=2 Tax=Oryza TaxID=4527 RepID=Q69Y77_ORYSJ|nr:hypothetical protein [Oryza sativa Japonica Group]